MAELQYSRELYDSLHDKIRSRYDDGKCLTDAEVALLKEHCPCNGCNHLTKSDYGREACKHPDTDATWANSVMVGYLAETCRPPVNFWSYLLRGCRLKAQ